MSTSTQLISGAKTASASVTLYNNPYGGGDGQSTEAPAQTIISTPGTIKNLKIKLSVAPNGVGKKYDITLYKNGVASALTVSIEDAATTGTDLSDQIAVVVGDTISIEVKPTNTPTVAKVFWNFAFVPTTAGETILLSSSGGNAITNNRFLPVLCYGDSGTSEVNLQVVIPTPGTIKNLYIKVNTAPGGTNTFIFTVNNNTTGQSTVVTLTGSATTGNDISNTFSVVAGDLLSIKRTGTFL